MTSKASECCFVQLVVHCVSIQTKTSTHEMTDSHTTHDIIANCEVWIRQCHIITQRKLAHCSCVQVPIILVSFPGVFDRNGRLAVRSCERISWPDESARHRTVTLRLSHSESVRAESVAPRTGTMAHQQKGADEFAALQRKVCSPYITFLFFQFCQ